MDCARNGVLLLCCARYAGVLRAAYKDAGHGRLDRTVRKSPFRQMDIHTCRQLYSRISAPFHHFHIPAPSLQKFAACAKNQCGQGQQIQAMQLQQGHSFGFGCSCVLFRTGANQSGTVFCFRWSGIHRRTAQSDHIRLSLRLVRTIRLRYIPISGTTYTKWKKFASV